MGVGAGESPQQAAPCLQTQAIPDAWRPLCIPRGPHMVSLAWTTPPGDPPATRDTGCVRIPPPSQRGIHSHSHSLHLDPGTDATAFQCWDPQSVENPREPQVPSWEAGTMAPTALQLYRAGIRLRSHLICKTFRKAVTAPQVHYHPYLDN